eukprot:TRINITY_DN5791_c0_g1_i5.p1 TRINITY_DN5791_c0_g1~~TRINITY_DN5791_c0_g1_i5.p1  ORF type:complete len:363 (+),score=49.16 TRINITY_DN5791_c0_g1_i5:424-1512(+)
MNHKKNGQEKSKSFKSNLLKIWDQRLPEDQSEEEVARSQDTENSHLKFRKHLKSAKSRAKSSMTRIKLRPGRVSFIAVMFYACLAVRLRKKFIALVLKPEEDIKPGLNLLCDFVKLSVRAPVKQILARDESLLIQKEELGQLKVLVKGALFKSRMRSIMDHIDRILNPIEKDSYESTIPPQLANFLILYVDGGTELPVEYVYDYEKSLREYGRGKRIQKLPMISQRILLTNLVFVKVLIMKILYAPSTEGFGTIGELQKNDILPVLRTILYRIARHSTVPPFTEQIGGDPVVYDTLLVAKFEYAYSEILDFRWYQKQSEKVYNTITNYLSQMYTPKEAQHQADPLHQSASQKSILKDSKKSL